MAKAGEHEYLTPKEIAGVLGISISSATTLVREHIPHHRIKPGARKSPYRVPVAAFREYMAATLVTPTKETVRAPATKGLPPGVKRFV